MKYAGTFAPGERVRIKWSGQYGVVIREVESGLYAGEAAWRVRPENDDRWLVYGIGGLEKVEEQPTMAFCIGERVRHKASGAVGEVVSIESKRVTGEDAATYAYVVKLDGLDGVKSQRFGRSEVESAERRTVAQVDARLDNLVRSHTKLRDTVGAMDRVHDEFSTRIADAEQRLDSIFGLNGDLVALRGVDLAGVVRDVPGLAMKIDNAKRRISRIESQAKEDQRRRLAIANGPRSYEKRIAELERQIAALVAIEREIVPSAFYEPARVPDKVIEAIYRARPDKADAHGNCSCKAVEECDGSCDIAEQAMYERLYGSAAVDEDSVEPRMASILVACEAMMAKTYRSAIANGESRDGALNRVLLQAQRICRAVSEAPVRVANDCNRNAG